MAALAPITINDGASTPVAHTFNPVMPDKNGVCFHYDRSSGVAIGYPMISLELKDPRRATPTGSSTSNRVYRAKIKIVAPVMDITSPTTGTGIQPAPTKAYETVASIEFILPERSDLLARKHILAYAKNLLAHSTITSLVQDLEGVY